MRCPAPEQDLTAVYLLLCVAAGVILDRLVIKLAKSVESSEDEDED